MPLSQTRAAAGIHNAGVPARDRPRRKLNQTQVEALVGVAFISPWLIGFAVFWVWPLGYSFWLSFTDYNLVQPPRFVGLANYSKMLFDDDSFWTALWVTCKLVAIYVPLTVLLALGVALLLNVSGKGTNLFRAAFFLPSVTPVIAASMLWLWIFSPRYGLLNHQLRELGLPTLDWIGSPDTALASVMIVMLWLTIGGPRMLIFLAGLKDIPKELYEAASLDGAGRFKSFLHVTLPLMTPVIFLNVVVAIIYSFQTFVVAYSMTGGGPVHATNLYVLHLYGYAFQFFKMGYASALSWVLFVIILAFTALQFRLARRWVRFGHE
uniref:Putative sugar ABC transporter permease n=1 Tax=uncultured bacterium 1114 TaxID=548901 RepID=B8R928_9BACT|nr:putative sugar ABC transporter permease [uncultured bacterium 1114]